MALRAQLAELIALLVEDDDESENEECGEEDAIDKEVESGDETEMNMRETKNSVMRE